ncbi:Reverse transcriptase RNA-dependent DNA polymerase [Arabidopsis thaliana x Arabidopsis arenosa]|uniref:Reverse transcriptase RNA-dependent DNA polymerase n=1 Tax=Arabidopsis thaliana x Arabidopsis arenosa TaxID=1240361 RepID=A0A8T1Z317_9BRAS|nr:Reverse transcriptase RNA-dependent DNA polymerase [Arabidopsis thaliana x Arabidopsis arenosa]
MASGGGEDDAAARTALAVTAEGKVSKRRTIHPYDLSATDNPGTVISQVLLNGDNFEDWARELRTALRARKKFGFVDGSIKKPEEDSEEIEDWWTINSLLVSWIRNSIDSSLRRDISHFEIAKELWDDIAEQYGIVSGPRIQQLKHELVTCKQKGLSIKSYYGKLKKLWEDLADYDKEDQCVCNDCTCDSKGRGARKREKDKVHQFLMGLDETVFGALKSSLLTRDPLPSLNQAFSIVQRDETVRLGNKETEKGHGEERCYQRHGYPVWWKGAKNERPDRLQSSALAPARVKPTAHVIGPIPQATANQVMTPSSVSTPSGFTTEQWETLMNTFHLGKTKAAETLTVGLPDGRFSVATKQGTVSLGQFLCLLQVLYVEGLNCHLVSVSQMIHQNKCFAHFGPGFCAIQDRSRMLIGAGEEQNGLYFFREVKAVGAVSLHVAVTVDIWHRRLGHPSSQVISLIPGIHVSRGREVSSSVCEVCFRAKQTRDCFPTSINKTTEIFQLIHCDVWGPYRTPSSSGARYFLTIVDDFSRGVWLFLMTAKSETPTHMKRFLAMTSRQFGKDVKVVRSDNGTEFICMKDFFFECGIIHETSCVGTPQQNGRVERKHRHILNVARALRFQSNLPINYWGECVLAAAHLINRTPLIVLDGKTPYEILFGKLPSFEHLRVFGCLCFVHNQHHGDVSRSMELSDSAPAPVDLHIEEIPGVAVGERSTDPSVAEIPDDAGSIDHGVRSTDPSVAEIPDGAGSIDHGVRSIDRTVAEIPEGERSIDPPSRSIDPDTAAVNPEFGNSESCPVSNRGFNQQEVVEVADHGESLVSDPQEEERLGRGCRQKMPSVLLKEYIVEKPSKRAPDGYPISNYVDCNRFSESHRAFLMAVSDNYIPTSFADAMKYEHWRKAMEKEVGSLQESKTWDLEDLPSGKRALYSRNWELHQMDVHNAFLHGDLKEEVYMKLPPGFKTDLPSRVCRLRKSLYGLKQAPRCWFAKLTAALTTYGFTQSRSDYSLFSFIRDGIQLYILVYVDDLAIMGNDHAAIERFKDYLSSCFHMKDLGVLKYFLGIEIARNTEGIYLTQRKYTLDIISETGLMGAKPVNFPLDQNHKLAVSKSELLQDPERYRRLVGRLIYLAVTRPDLAYCVHILSQFMQVPRQDHWDAALRVVRYLKGTAGQGILLSSDCDLHVRGWCDSDWEGCPLTRRSSTGWFIQLGSSPISWRTKKHDRVSMSSAEAEYRAMGDTTKELLWIKACLRDFGVMHSSPMSLFCDNEAALHIAANPVFHERTKHVESDCHFIRDEIVAGVIATQHVPTEGQLADIFTKALGAREFLAFQDKLGILNLHAPT